MSDKRLHTKPRNLFEKCKAQSPFDGKLSIIFEDPGTGDVVREECEWCQQEYAETAAALLKARPGLRKLNKDQKQRAFDKAYLEKFSKSITGKEHLYLHGATLLSKKHEFMTVAHGAEPLDAYYSLGKYAQTICKGLQSVNKAGVAGIRGKNRIVN